MVDTIKLPKNPNKNKIVNKILFFILWLVVVVSIFSALYFGLFAIRNHLDKDFVMVGYSGDGITFVNEDVDVYIIDFNKLEKDVDYTIIESEIYYFVNDNSRVYILATKNEVKVYVYNNRLYVSFYDIKHTTLRLSKNDKIDLRE